MTDADPSPRGNAALVCGFTVLTAVAASVLGGFHPPMQAALIPQAIAVVGVIFGLFGLAKDGDKGPAKGGLLLAVVMLIVSAGWL